ncbi:Ribosomal RNA small subunit methyltransferase G [Thiorhodovibrio winogradskyi]|uniref:Ribosomal RNA small subunit methyltransferase G n=1 Tax=Thiorhodovibrio winogradskyi TaxID=77007 RepID=A0ABZ0SDZ0_9GAMM|nr:16S rRNA (guanine(527)-N(7))-methyltransferase RsmG [Thiorhodovibrio winogradskyi]
MLASLRQPLSDRLHQGCARLGAPVANLSEAQRNALLDYVDLLAHWNSRFNLTAVRDPLDMIGHHLLDSLAAVDAFVASPVLDLGTGAGLPGIPLAIARPELQFVLLDSIGKKTRFVRQAAASLELANVTVIQARFESYQPAEKFATITARALAPLAALWSGSAHLRQPGAALLAYKGRRPDDEIATLRPPAGATGEGPSVTRVSVTRLEVPFVPGERHLIRID